MVKRPTVTVILPFKTWGRVSTQVIDFSKNQELRNLLTQVGCGSLFLRSHSKVEPDAIDIAECNFQLKDIVDLEHALNLASAIAREYGASEISLYIDGLAIQCRVGDTAALIFQRMIS